MNWFVRILMWLVLAHYWALPALLIGGCLAIVVGLWLNRPGIAGGPNS